MKVEKASAILTDLIGDGFSVALAADSSGAVIDVATKSTTVQYDKLKTLMEVAEKHAAELLIVNGQLRYV